MTGIVCLIIAIYALVWACLRWPHLKMIHLAGEKTQIQLMLKDLEPRYERARTGVERKQLAKEINEMRMRLSEIAVEVKQLNESTIRKPFKQNEAFIKESLEEYVERRNVYDHIMDKHDNEKEHYARKMYEAKHRRRRNHVR